MGEGLEIVFRGQRDSGGDLWVVSLPGVLATGVVSGPSLEFGPGIW